MEKFRFKVKRDDGSIYFITHRFFKFGGCFIFAAELTQTTADVASVDIYYCNTDKLIATFYK